MRRRQVALDVELVTYINYKCIYYTRLSYHYGKCKRAGSIKHVVMYLGHI